MNADGGDPLLSGAIGASRDDLAERWQADPWDDVRAVADQSTEELRDPGRRFARPLRVIASAIVVLVLLAGVVGWWFVRQLNPSGEPGAAVNFTVNDGDTISSVAARLEQQGIIVNASVFRWYVSSKGGLELSPGYYSLKPRDDAGRILTALATPPAQSFVSVTFPEGMTLSQMATRLSEKITFMSAEQFMAAATDGSVSSSLSPKGSTNLEGLLFPDTYQVSGDETEARVVGRLVAMMDRVAKQEVLADSRRLVGLSQYQTLIVASLIEREAKVPEDRAKIARVIYNRLSRKMKLEIDASLKYGADPGTPFSELKARDTPYNTYLYKGLPPTPIANPGRASIRAALEPAGDPSATDEACAGLSSGVKCEYLYYVLIDKAGRHAFSTTYEQHLANIEKARAAGVLP